MQRFATLCQRLFALADSLGALEDRHLTDPTRNGVHGVRVGVGRRLFPPCLFYGSERQFHRWNRPILTAMFREAFGLQDAFIQRHQGQALNHILEDFFRPASDAPALVWASPVWLRVVNRMEKERLRMEDQTRPIDRFQLGLVGPAVVPVHLGGSGEAVNVRLRGPGHLRFRFPERALNYVRVPRWRWLYGLNGELHDMAVEESLALGHPGEEAVLNRGLYTGNFPYHHDSGGVRFMDLCTITLARLSPRRVAEPIRGVPDLDARRGGRLSFERYRRVGCVDPVLDPAYPSDAWVRFVRLTVDPEDDLRVVVSLCSERIFWRFVVEHTGMAEMLDSAFGMGVS